MTHREERSDARINIGDVVQMIVDQATRDHGRLTPSSILMLGSIAREAKALLADLAAARADIAEFSKTVEYFDAQSKRRRDERDVERLRADRAEAEVGRTRALCDRYGIVSLDEALAEWAALATTGEPVEPEANQRARDALERVRDWAMANEIADVPLDWAGLGDILREQLGEEAQR